jgi:hypothetical protein
MQPFSLSQPQLAVIGQPLEAKIFLEGPAGSGKTTAGVERILRLMQNGIAGNSILLLVPQRSLAKPYQQALNMPGVTAGGVVTSLTVGGLARRMVELFWPLVARQAGFGEPNRGPVFLTLETAQYYMARLARPKLDEGYFESVVIDRNRLYSQILDNLNKAALVGFPHTEFGERLKAAWSGEPAQGRVYTDAQVCANDFRAYCLEHNLLDFSLQVEIFTQYLWSNTTCRGYLMQTYRHIIADNLEEEPPVTHGLLHEWLPDLTSALLIYDQDGGYRTFLGADPSSGYALKSLCPTQLSLEGSFVMGTEIQSLEENLASMLKEPGTVRSFRERHEPLSKGTALEIEYERYFPQMLDSVANRIAKLVNDQGVPPGDIAVLSPYLSDALRFALVNRLEKLGIPARSQRPSRALRDEPATQCVLTLATLAHPQWIEAAAPNRFDFVYMLLQAIRGMDLVRAQLLSEIVYRPRQETPETSSFERIKPDVQERITYRLGELFESLRRWLEEYRQGPHEELDHFLSRLFGELLSQPGFGFHGSYQAGEVVANLIESIQKFRWATGSSLAETDTPVGKEYLKMVAEGVIAAQYLRSWRTETEDIVLLAPAYTFLMINHPVEVQFWLDIGSRGWYERLFQPLTHPYVLSRSWSADRQWTAIDEYESSQRVLSRLVTGLVRRCRSKLVLCQSELGEQGYEQRGEMLYAFQHLLRETWEQDSHG